MHLCSVRVLTIAKRHEYLGLDTSRIDKVSALDAERSSRSNGWRDRMLPGGVLRMRRSRDGGWAGRSRPADDTNGGRTLMGKHLTFGIAPVAAGIVVAGILAAASPGAVASTRRALTA